VSGGYTFEALTVRDDVEIIARLDAEQRIDLIEHLPVLAGDDHNGLEKVGCFHRGNQGGQLYGLRPRAIDDEYPAHEPPPSLYHRRSATLGARASAPNTYILVSR